MISASKLTSRSMLAGGGTPIESGGGSTASGGRLADDADGRCRCLARTALWSWRAYASSARTSPAQLRTLLSPGFAWGGKHGFRARHFWTHIYWRRLASPGWVEHWQALPLSGQRRHLAWHPVAHRARHCLPALCPPQQPSLGTQASCHCWTGAAQSAPAFSLLAGCLWRPHAWIALVGVGRWYIRTLQ